MATKWWISTSSTSFTTAANYSDNAAPANGDTIIFNHLGTASVLTNLGSSLTTLTVIVEKSYTGSIGVLAVGGSSGTYLTMDGGTVHIERPAAFGSGSGSSLLMFDTGTGTN